MKLNFNIKAPPFSINKAYYKRSMTRTQECRKWGDSVLIQLQDPLLLDQFTQVREAFNPKKHTISVELQFNIPQCKFYTKKGEVSIHSQDLSNVEKLLIDLIFDSRFNDRQIKDISISNLNINDKFITELISRKVPVDAEHSIDIQIKII